MRISHDLLEREFFSHDTSEKGFFLKSQTIRNGLQFRAFGQVWLPSSMRVSTPGTSLMHRTTYVVNLKEAEELFSTFY